MSPPEGFPSFDTPEFVVKCVQDALGQGIHNQYTRPGGNPILVQTLAEMYSPLFQRELDPMSEVSVCSGAQEGIFNILATYCNPGDQVVCIEPYFDAYKKAADLVGAETVGVPLRLEAGGATSADFKLNLGDLERAITDNTKLLILNTPHNPTGKVFSLEELEGIASVVRRHPGLIVLSDEGMCFSTPLVYVFCSV